MKLKWHALSGRYQVALRRHLSRNAPPGLAAARRLGREAAAIGLETLDLARIHQRAIVVLRPAANSRHRRADIFFAETIKPFQRADEAGLRKASDGLKRLNKRLRQRTQALTACNRSLKREMAVRKAARETLKKGAEHYQTLLKESLALQRRLQRMVRRALSAKESKRSKLSHQLQDEIGQTLLGINVRLLTVKRAASHSAKSLQEEIARTERLVDRSVKNIERCIRE